MIRVITLFAFTLSAFACGVPSELRSVARGDVTHDAEPGTGLDIDPEADGARVVALSANAEHSEAVLFDDGEAFASERSGCRGVNFWSPEADIGLTADGSVQLHVADGRRICEVGAGFTSPSEIPYTCDDEDFFPASVGLYDDNEVEPANRAGFGFIVVDGRGNMTQVLVLDSALQDGTATVRLAVE